MGTTVKHALIPAQRTYGWGHPPMTNHAFDHHEMTILLDQGLYRHLRFEQPSAFATRVPPFEIFTSPGNLGIAGEMGTYIFARLDDMFVFFETPNGRVNPEYWSEKVTAQAVHAPVRCYSPEAFRKCILQDYHDRKYAFDSEDQQRLLHHIQTQILDHPDAQYEKTAQELLRRFYFRVDRHDQVPVVFDYADVEICSFTDFHPRFLWCLEAIVFGIEQYKKQTGHV